MSLLSEFANSATALAKNPLGIIALFIVLLYAIAGLVLGSSLDKLHGQLERLPFLYFLILFPFVVLAVFTWLVVKHHKKLYAPGDFKTDDAFLKALTPEVQKERIEREVAELIPETTPPLLKATADDPTAARRKVIREDIILAEDLALRELTVEFGSAIRRQVVLDPEDKQIGLDAIVTRDGEIICVEVKFINSMKNVQQLAAQISYLASRIVSVGLKVKSSLLVIAVVHELSAEQLAKVTERLSELGAASVLPITVRMRDFDELKARFGVQAESR